MSRIWRVYNNGSIKEETRVLHPHYSGGQRCTGYDGDVKAWSEYNQVYRFGCAQIHKPNEGPLEVLFNGYLDATQLATAVTKITQTLEAELKGNKNG